MLATTYTAFAPSLQLKRSLKAASKKQPQKNETITSAPLSPVVSVSTDHDSYENRDLSASHDRSSDTPCDLSTESITEIKRKDSSSDLKDNEPVKLDETISSSGTTSPTLNLFVQHWPAKKLSEGPKLRLSRNIQTCEICGRFMRNASSLLVHYQQHAFMDSVMKNATAM